MHYIPYFPILFSLDLLDHIFHPYQTEVSHHHTNLLSNKNTQYVSPYLQLFILKETYDN